MTNQIPTQETLITKSIDDKNSSILCNEKIVVFLVDDDKLYLKSLEALFHENSNFLVTTFLTGEACLQNIYLKPDVIILDYFLNSSTGNSKNGLEIMTSIKEVSVETPVIMLSSNESAEIAVNCMKKGAFDYTIKNENTFLKLKQSIKKILSISSKEKELIVWDW